MRCLLWSPAWPIMALTFQFRQLTVSNRFERAHPRNKQWVARGLQSLESDQGAHSSITHGPCHVGGTCIYLPTHARVTDDHVKRHEIPSIFIFILTQYHTHSG